MQHTVGTNKSGGSGERAGRRKPTHATNEATIKEREGRDPDELSTRPIGPEERRSLPRSRKHGRKGVSKRCLEKVCRTGVSKRSKICVEKVRRKHRRKVVENVLLKKPYKTVDNFSTMFSTNCFRQVFDLEFETFDSEFRL